MEKRREICLTWEEGSSPLSYEIISGDVISVSSSCATENCFTVEGTEFEIEFTFKNEVVTKTYKICDEDSECSGCEECVNNICVATCQQMCYGSTCVECLVNDDCDEGYICTAFGCVIAPGYKECVNGDIKEECEEDCTSCQEYVNSVCVSKVCPPADECLSFGETSKSKCLNGECVECINTGDCGTNECCFNNECDCCNGFTRDRITNTCVPEDDCFDSSFCGECETCTSGKCMPVVCPAGFICLGGNCVQTCGNSSDCPDGVCLDGICASTSSTPCAGEPCITNETCGEGCGCDGSCVDCSFYICTGDENCPQGCSCVNNVCAYIDIPEPDENCVSVVCVEGSDCGEGCGCLDGYCTSCSNLDCFTDECSDASGCECDDNLNCIATECDNLLSIVKGACSASFNISGDIRCACPTIGVGNSITMTPDNGKLNMSLTLELRKGSFVDYTSFTNNLLLSDTGIMNEIPNSGTIRVITRIRYRRTDAQGNPVGTQQVLQTHDSQNVTFIGVDTRNITITAVPNIGDIVTINNQYHRVTNIDIYREQQAFFTFPNECTYDTSLVHMYSFFGGAVDPAVSFSGTATYLSPVTGSSRLPLLSVYKSNSAGNYTSLAYAEYSQGMTLYYPFVEQFKYYKLTSDCGCADDVVYECNDIENRLVICDPTDFQFETTNCGKNIRFLQDVTVTCDIVLNSNTKYKLLADGNVVVGNRAISGNGVVFHAGEIINVGYVFSEVTLAIVGDFCEECSVTKPVPYFDLLFSIEPPSSVVEDCDTSGDATWGLTVFNGSPNYIVTVYKDGNLVYQGEHVTNSSTFDIPSVIGEYVINVTDSGGCSNEQTIDWEPDVVNNLEDSTVTYECDGVNVVFTLNSGTTVETNATIVYDGDDYVVAFIGTGQISIPYEEGGEYIVTIEFADFTCDPYEETLEVTCCDPNPLDGGANPIYTCHNGLILPNGDTLDYLYGIVTLTQGQSLDPGLYDITIVSGGCTREVVLSVPTCYNCFNTACLASTIVPGHPDNTCDGVCIDPTEFNVEITYDCETGLLITADTPVLVFVEGTPVANGAIIDAGVTVFTVVETENAVQYDIENVIPQCLECQECVDDVCCQDAVPNIGYNTCPEICTDPPAECLLCISMVMATEAGETLSEGVMRNGVDWLFRDEGFYDLSVPSNVTRFIDDFTAAIAAEYPLSTSTCFNEITVELVTGEYIVTVNCMCDEEEAYDWRFIVGTSVSYAATTDTCVPDPIEPCVCPRAEGSGNLITGVFDSAINIFTDPIFTLTEYNLLNATQRALLESELLDYYTVEGGGCEVTVEVTYNALTSATVISVSCLDSSLYEAPRYFQSGTGTLYPFFQEEICECVEGNYCLNKSYTLDLLTADGDITELVLFGFNLSTEVGFNFPYDPTVVGDRDALYDDFMLFLAGLTPCCDIEGVVPSSLNLTAPDAGVCTLTIQCLPSTSEDLLPIRIEQTAVLTDFTEYDQGYECCSLP